jgi:ferredoxin
MIRKIIHIDEEKCNGCGLCATACHEGAIDIINGKAKLVRENFCDGFGDCLPGCPTGAITFEEREAPAYDEAAVQENKKKKELQERMQKSIRSISRQCGFVRWESRKITG